MRMTGTGRVITVGIAVGIVAILLSTQAGAQDAPKPGQPPQKVAVPAKTATTNKAPHDAPSPAKILEDTAAAYQALDTYKSEGTIVSNIEMNGKKTTRETTFSILLKKPNLYLITWNMTVPVVPVADAGGAVWSDGTQPYLYMGVAKSFYKMKGDNIALGAATGISGGAASTIPSLFLAAFKDQPSPATRLKDAKSEPDEKVGDEDCYVVSGATDVSKKETYWITKSKHLVVKFARSLEVPEKDKAMPELTDAQIEDTIKAVGQEVTEEKKQGMRDMMKKATETVKTLNLKGLSTETHTQTSSPELGPKDFQYTVPEGVALKEFPFGAGQDAGGAKPPAPAGGDAR